MKEAALLVALICVAVTNIGVLIGNKYFLEQMRRKFVCWKIDEANLLREIRRMDKEVNKMSALARKDEIVICKHCNQPEYWGDMRWNNGRCMCRNCYKEDYERTRKQPYKWDDLDGRRPTMDEYMDQEENRNEDKHIRTGKEV